MQRTIKISEMKAIDKTAILVLRTISLQLGEDNEGYVDYNLIAKSNDLSRNTVAKAVNRMVKKKILKKEKGKLSILNSVVID
jgi:RIO-like serine/threonine protein kinase